ncbi:MAG TPA: tetratricopeptide repeat protein [Pyrinomonadaceae bacterium]|nr:tetratricopeptide repeat protein [Pyrinomonadaceae bacterium]
MRAKFIFSLILPLLFIFAVFAQPRKAAPTQAATRTITIVTEPKAEVWLDDVKYGATNESGNLTLRNIPGGVRKLRVRGNGFKEVAQNLLPAQKGEVKIALTRTTDEAELAFQEAETSTDRKKAVELYRKAIDLRPKYAEANLGLARVLLAQGDTEAALEAVQAAKKARPVYSEATAVEGRIYTEQDEPEKAVAAFKRALTEGKGFQPEAHAGLGLFYKEKAEGFGSSGDFENEKQNYIIAAAALKKAAAQLGTAPDAVTIYQLLGDSYEKAKMFPEAIKVYEDFLRLFPDSDEASIMESFIVQIKKRQQEGKQ